VSGRAEEGVGESRVCEQSWPEHTAVLLCGIYSTRAALNEKRGCGDPE